MDFRSKKRERIIRWFRDKNIIIPTFEEMSHPENIPGGIKDELSEVGMGDLNPRNLFRITWKNEPAESGGGFGDVNIMEFPMEMTGVRPRILMLVGKYFPTGSHKVGAAIGPLVERLLRGEFDPLSQKALWPSTGNYCRGGAFISRLLGCPHIAVLPEGMSRERFEWLKKMGAEIHTTSGSESNVKEVYDKTYALKKESPDEIVVLNQFEEFGNAAWHYSCTGRAIEEVFRRIDGSKHRLAALFLTQGSAGTLASGDYLREKYPQIKIGAGEALQCPTLLYNGHGEHRIEGIGDKHVPWIHNLKNMDFVAGIDDNICMRLLRLFNEPIGRAFLKSRGIPNELVDRLDLLGISSIANLMGMIKTARYFEMNEKDVLFSVCADSMALYHSRWEELRTVWGRYTEIQAAMDYEAGLEGLDTDHLLELSYRDKKRMHNLKYFTWVEQRGKTVEELDRQWNDDTYWTEKLDSYKKWDKRIRQFNAEVGLRRQYESNLA